MRKKIVFLVLLHFISYSVFTQENSDACSIWHYQMDTTSNVDFALDASLTTYKIVDEYCQIEILNTLGEIYIMKSDIDSAFYYFNTAIQRATALNAEELLISAQFRKAGLLIDYAKVAEGEQLLIETKILLNKHANSEHWIGYYNRRASLEDYKGNYLAAIAYTDSVLITAVRLNQLVEIPDTYHNLGVYYFKFGDYEKSAESLLKALEVKEQIKGSDFDVTYYILGVCYNAWEQYETGKFYLQKATNMAVEYGNDHIAMKAYNGLATSNRHLNMAEVALSNVDSALVYAEKMERPRFLAESLLEKGRIYFYDLKEYPIAGHYITAAYNAAIASKNYLTIYPCTQEMIALSFYNEDYDKVKKLLKTQEQITNEHGLFKYKMEFNKTSAEYYERINEPAKALPFYKTYHFLKDSLANENIISRVADLEKKYDTKNKELAIIQLNQENDAQKQVTSKAETRQKIYLSIAILLFLLIVAGTWVYFKLRKQQNELSLAHENLEELNQVKSRLFSIIAHDLRGMIIPFQRAGKIFKYHIDKGNYDRSLALSVELEKNSAQLSNMLDNLLQWSLEQMNGYQPKPTTLSISNELTEIVKGYQQQADYKKTAFVLDITENAELEFDHGAFHVIFRNLIGNALKYTKEGTISLTYKVTQNTHEFEIKDTGIGMSETELGHLFSMINKPSTTGTNGEKGTGLGLNLVYRFVEIHKGTVTASSVVNKGTSFVLTFPK